MQQPDKIPNFDKKESEIATNIDKWMWLFKNLGEAKKMPLFMDSRALKRVFQITEVANLSEEEPMAYEASLRHKMEWRDYLRYRGSGA